MKKFYVYIHTCTANGKHYVGCTTRVKPELRWAEGKGYQNNDHFYRAILKYGWSNFQHEVFEVESEEEMYRKEVELISFYHSNDPKYGYNHSSGGEKSASGCIRSEETRKHMAEAQKKKAKDPEYLKKLSEIAKKRWLDPEYRKKQLEARKGRPPISEETREKLRNASFHKDPEYRRKWSEACKNRPRISIKLPDDTIIKITKQHLIRDYVNKGKEFEYVS